ncbi:YolA family protein [Janthinobacterium agaricidamnosum]|uniref:DUF4879 domain-containing protein n=1 Tax=Janthinobacterium agaricidamnosum NBRC 102515 = DSM 9628 TaxID=1349767 RepID=W0V4B2_9BURK|nr:YolA family protein [Janthinobacterium agaricidamnosum]CDG83669.1 putative uncharacterized protein [Janthinobacterium agaricidamnosum NBRC 102515 = DSM 9628]
MTKKFALPIFISMLAFMSTNAYSQENKEPGSAQPENKVQFALAAADASGDAMPVKLSEVSLPALESQGVLSVASGGDSLAPKGPQLAPAPALSRVAIYAVGSSNCDWEYMTILGQLSTTCDHGGQLLRVAVQEIGYGASPFAWMNGGLLPQSANYTNQSICIVGNNYVWPCPAGYTVVGWMKYYNLDGQQSGKFQFQDTSINAPFNTLSTSILIK